MNNISYTIDVTIINFCTTLQCLILVNFGLCWLKYCTFFLLHKHGCKCSKSPIFFFPLKYYSKLCQNVEEKEEDDNHMRLLEYSWERGKYTNKSGTCNIDNKSKYIKIKNKRKKQEKK